jgi:hypothetical protein
VTSVSRCRAASILGALLAALLLSACDLFTPLTDESYRFRMTVEIETPEGLRTGSSVYEVTAGNRTAILPDMADRHKSLRGEALTVDLPDGRTLFALLETPNWQRDDLTEMSMDALDPAYNNDWVESAERISDGSGVVSPAEVTPENYPYLVTFRNPQEPETVQRIDPANLTKSFGEGVRLTRIWVELVDDPVTTGIGTRLRWLGGGRRELRGRPFGSQGMPTFDITRLFSTELAD